MPHVFPELAALYRSPSFQKFADLTGASAPGDADIMPVMGLMALVIQQLPEIVTETQQIRLVHWWIKLNKQMCMMSGLPWTRREVGAVARSTVDAPRLNPKRRPVEIYLLRRYLGLSGSFGGLFTKPDILSDLLTKRTLGSTVEELAHLWYVGAATNLTKTEHGRERLSYICPMPPTANAVLQAKIARSHAEARIAYLVDSTDLFSPEDLRKRLGNAQTQLQSATLALTSAREAHRAAIQASASESAEARGVKRSAAAAAFEQPPAAKRSRPTPGMAPSVTIKTEPVLEPPIPTRPLTDAERRLLGPLATSPPIEPPLDDIYDLRFLDEAPPSPKPEQLWHEGACSGPWCSTCTLGHMALAVGGAPPAPPPAPPAPTLAPQYIVDADDFYRRLASARAAFDRVEASVGGSSPSIYRAADGALTDDDERRAGPPLPIGIDDPRMGAEPFE